MTEIQKSKCLIIGKLKFENYLGFEIWKLEFLFFFLRNIFGVAFSKTLRNLLSYLSDALKDLFKTSPEQFFRFFKLFV